MIAMYPQIQGNLQSKIFRNDRQSICSGIIITDKIVPRSIIKMDDLVGMGLIGNVLSTFNFLKKGKQLLGAIAGASVGPTATVVRNEISKLSDNPNKAPLFVGEAHALLKTKYNKTLLDNANFLGPGTRLDARIKRGDRPIDGSRGLDQCAMVHDLSYQNAKSFLDIRRADNKFLQCIDKSEGNKAVKTFVKGLFNAKKIGENLGVINPSLFASQVGRGDQAIEGTEFQKLPGLNLRRILEKKQKRSSSKRERKIRITDKRLQRSAADRSYGGRLQKMRVGKMEGGQLVALASLIASVAIPELIKVIKKAVKGKKKKKKKRQ